MEKETTKPNDPVQPLVMENTYIPGMTIRELFTIRAMQGILANPETTIITADMAIKIADDLIKELNEI